MQPLPRTRYDEHWSATVIDADGIAQEQLTLDADTPGRIDWKADQPSPLGARLDLIGPIPDLTQGQSVQLAYHHDDADPIALPPLAPQGHAETREMGAFVALQLIDQTITLAADGLDFPADYPVATPALATARALLTQHAPDLDVQLPTIDYTLREPITRPVSTDLLGLTRDLLAAAGATPLAPRLGQPGLHSEPLTLPSARPIAMAFGPEQVDAGYLPTVTLDTDYLATANVAHYHAGDIIGRWRDEDPHSRWSIPRRGRRILTQSRGEAATQAIADAAAQALALKVRRRRLDGSIVGGRGRIATITGAWQPLQPGDVIRVDHPDHPDVSGLWEILDCATTTALGSDTSWTIREVTL